jgi:anthranilate synthase/aminodeoxychorismate synthase-like glutamine amidotransferase
MIVIIDNYDSFTYNLVHLVAAQVGNPGATPGSEPLSTADRKSIVVYRNDRTTIEEIEDLNPAGILISPGPGRPADAGITCSIIESLGDRIPILGVCLGHQAIGEVYGGTIAYAPTLMHGKTSLIRHDGKTIVTDIMQDFVATRYHSLVVSEAGLPDCLTVSARTPDNVIMGLRHTTHPLEGIQFHPESLLTTEGPKMISNWVSGLHIAA